MRLQSKTVSILSELFFIQITALIPSDTLKRIIGVSGKRSTPGPEAVTVHKNKFASPPPVPSLSPFKSLVGLVILASIFILFFTLRAVSI